MASYDRMLSAESYDVIAFNLSGSVASKADASFTVKPGLSGDAGSFTFVSNSKGKFGNYLLGINDMLQGGCSANYGKGTKDIALLAPTTDVDAKAASWTVGKAPGHVKKLPGITLARMYARGHRWVCGSPTLPTAGARGGERAATHQCPLSMTW